MFSQFVQALNQQASSILQDGTQSQPSMSPRPSTSTPRTSLGGDHIGSPRANGQDGYVDGMTPPNPNPNPNPNPASPGQPGQPGYSTYQRRTKLSLEDRLKASLAAKEKRDLESAMYPSSPSTAPTSSLTSPVTNHPGRTFGAIASAGAGAGNANTIANANSSGSWDAESVVSREGSITMEGNNVLFIQTGDQNGNNDGEEGDPLKTPLPASPTTETLPPLHEEKQPEVATTETNQLPVQNIETGEMVGGVSSQEDTTPRAEKVEAAELPNVPNQDASTAIESESKSAPISPPETPSKNVDPLLPAKARPAFLLAPPPKVTTAGLGFEDSAHSADPLSARDKTPPPPPPIAKDGHKHEHQQGYEYSDPLTPALQELEREQKAAAARSLRSPASPQPPPTPRKPYQHHQATRSNASVSMVPEGEPFVRLHSRADSFPIGLVGAFSSIEGMEAVHDLDGVKDFVRRLQEKLETSQGQITRLNSKLGQQDSRIEEIRDMHKLESSSQSELIESLRTKLADTETLISSFQAASSHQTDSFDAMKAEMVTLRAENEKNKVIAKDEEEKRTKAISLLKTVRTKLVKAEKERDELSQELGAIKENERGTKERGEDEVLKLRNEVERMRNEIERVRADSAREVARVKEDGKKELAKSRAQADLDAAAQREAMEREILARRGEWEIEIIAAKTTHQKEMTNLQQRMNTINNSLSAMTDEKAQLFDDLQLRSSECESALTRLEDLQSQTTELNYQLREKDELVSMLQVELSEARRSPAVSASRTNMSGRGSIGGGGTADMAKLLSEAESRSEARLSELRTRIRTIEAERHEAEENWSKTLASRGEEIERLRNLLRDKEREWREVSEFRAIKEKEVASLTEEVEKLQTQLQSVSRKMEDVRREGEVMRENLGNRSFEVNDLKSRLEAANNLVDEYKGKESQLKTSNKTLREELRKVQSSATLLERQRNPGIGYWNAANPRSPVNNLAGYDTSATASSPDLTRSGRPATPIANGSTSGPGRAASASSARSSTDGKASVDGQAEEEVNVEYVRNVILQFLEHKEMRPNLVRVLAAILRFTPQETRRLIANI